MTRLDLTLLREDLWLGTEPQVCRDCGCIERTGEPCFWIEDDLCSACAEGQGDRP